jgi:uncharacterized protein YjbJ (UPF0337 family)
MGRGEEGEREKLKAEAENTVEAEKKTVSRLNCPMVLTYV